tara:strand:+ start:534 stop:1058 length:525 start_codon:yes stop_codon:yes gene_type:complete
MSKRLLLIFLSFFLFWNIVIAENSKVVYVDVDKIINQSIAGKSVTKQITNINSKNTSKFKKREQELIEIENRIIKKKNILSKDDFEKQAKALNSDVANFKQEINKSRKELAQKKLEATKKILNVLNSILSEYSDKNSISLIIQKKNIVIGKSELDITKPVLVLVNAKIKSVKLN